MIDKIKTLILTIPQLIAVFSLQKIKYLIWGRGAGKSFILAWFIRKAVITMPRACFGLVGESFIQIKSKTWPSTKAGLEKLGLIENIHFIVGRNGYKEGFKRPLYSPNKWDNVIHFWNGTILVMISLSDKNSGRGLNLFGFFADEGLTLDEKLLNDNVRTTIRAKEKQFENAELLGCEIVVSSMPITEKGKWILRKIKEAELKPKEVFCSLTTAYSNKANLLSGWFERMKTAYTNKVYYNAEMLNIEPPKVAKSFYPALDPKKHYYKIFDSNKWESLGPELLTKKLDSTTDDDCIANQPLRVSLDLGASIMTLKVSQQYKGGNTVLEHRTLKTFFDESPLPEGVIKKFNDYYGNHKRKKIILNFDRNANSKQIGLAITLKDQIVSEFKKYGWKVEVQTPRTLNPPHYKKFVVMNYLLKYGGTQGLPKILINESHNQDFIISIESTPAKDSKNGLIEKDKSSERSKTLPQQHATHFSDAWDYDLYWEYHEKVFSLINSENYSNDMHEFMYIFN